MAMSCFTARVSDVVHYACIIFVIAGIDSIKYKSLIKRPEVVWAAGILLRFPKSSYSKGSLS